MPDRKAGWLAENFERIQAEGGPEAIKQKLAAVPGREGKLGFLRSFRGIGPKYGRGMLMIVYHPEFRESIELDVRVRKVSKALGLQFSSYEAEEQFFLSAAAGAGISGWELDRLLYGFADDILAALAQQNSATA